MALTLDIFPVYIYIYIYAVNGGIFIFPGEISWLNVAS